MAMRAAMVGVGFKAQRAGARSVPQRLARKQTSAPRATLGAAPIKEQVIHFINKKLPGRLAEEDGTRAAGHRGPRTTCPSSARRQTTTSETEAVFYFPGCGSERLFSARWAWPRRPCSGMPACRRCCRPVTSAAATRSSGSGQFDKAEKMITDNRVLFHRVANTLNYLDIKTVVVSCGTCYDQLQGYKFEDIFPGCRIIDIHEYLLEKGITLGAGSAGGYLYHDPCHTPMKLQEPMKTVKALVGENVVEAKRCCGESGGFAMSRPDVSTQVRFRKEEELRKNETTLRATGAVAGSGPVKVLTSCPSCLMGLSRYTGDLTNGLLEADYIVVEMANQILGADWMPDYVELANEGGIERVLV